MVNRDGELCDEGSALWSDMFREYSHSKYLLYVDHISSCKDCMKRLGIDSVISEGELIGDKDGNDNR